MGGEDTSEMRRKDNVTVFLAIMCLDRAASDGRRR
jgi:hypothetical protein